MEPFKLVPCFKNYMWGGNKLKSFYGKKSGLTSIAESWELSAHEDGSSVISSSNKNIDKMPLAEFVKKHKEALGTKQNGELSILVKIIDANDDLSIQVHPNDEFAQKHERSLGKTEAWHVLDHDDGAFIYLGLNKHMSKQQFKKATTDGTITSALNKVFVKKGDTFLINAGTVHSICKGVVVAEIQQSSNVTYRVYDYNRMDADGKTRELHIEKAAMCADLNKMDLKINGEARRSTHGDISGEETVIANCEYFKVRAINIKSSYNCIMTEQSFAAVLAAEGSMQIEYRGNDGEGQRLYLSKGETAFIPAGKAAYKMYSNGGETKALVITADSIVGQL